MEKLSKRNLAVSAAIGGIAAGVVNLLVEYRLNCELVAADYMTSAILVVLTALAIFTLFRNRPGNSCD